MRTLGAVLPTHLPAQPDGLAGLVPDEVAVGAHVSGASVSARPTPWGSPAERGAERSEAPRTVGCSPLLCACDREGLRPRDRASGSRERGIREGRPVGAWSRPVSPTKPLRIVPSPSECYGRDSVLSPEIAQPPRREETVPSGRLSRLSLGQVRRSRRRMARGAPLSGAKLGSSSSAARRVVRMQATTINGWVQSRQDPPAIEGAVPHARVASGY